MWRLAPLQLWLWKRNVLFECEDQGLEGWMSLSQESIVNFYALLLLFSDKLILFFVYSRNVMVYNHEQQ